MYHFNENNIVTGFIKEMLHNFELPTCQVYVNGETEVYPNTNYIYRHSVILTDDWSDSDNVYELQNNYRHVQDYVYGQFILNLTKKLKLNSILYDTYTHEYLGNYLRFYRDYTGVDLMMLYNCFSNRMAQNLNYHLINPTEMENKNPTNFTTSDDDYKIYLVPIKFNKKYLIGIDSDVKVEFVCGLIDENVQITDVNTDSLYRASYQSFNSLSFSQPQEYDTHFTDSIDVDLRQFESCLRLIIKLPANNKSSISIVEVSSPAANFTQMVDGNIPDIELVGGTKLKEYPSKLSLFKINDGVSYPFADRLIEYLFGQAITSTEIIGENIERVKLQLADVAQKKRNGTILAGSQYGYDGVWNDHIRQTVYKAATFPHTDDEIKFTKNNYDLTYYIDKDIEKLITVVDENI